MKSKEKFVSGAMDASIVLYCVGILSNLLANNQRNKEYVFNQNGITALFRVLLNSCNIPANTVSLQQKVEDIQVKNIDLIFGLPK